MRAIPEPASRYTRVAIALHWLIGLLVIGNLAGGLLLDTLFPEADAAAKAGRSLVIGLHKSIGLTILALTLARIAWRLGHRPPPLPHWLTAGERLAARATHVGFYGLMLLMPLSGWLMVSAGKYPLTWFGLFGVPKWPIAKPVAGVFHETHEIAGWLMLATLVLHVGAVLKHRWLDRHDILPRMLPARR